MDSLIAYFIGSGIVCLCMFLTKNKVLDYLLFIPFVILQVYMNIHEYSQIGVAKTGFEEYFKLDKLGFIFLTLLTIISIPTIIHSAIYAFSREESSKETEVHNISLVLFIVMMSGAIISYNLGLMWAFLEATTLCASMLIYHERNAEALEAAWKYVFVCSIGIALAFVGILFLGMANKTLEMNFNIDALSQSVLKMDPRWLKMSFLFIVTGYSVKMGIVPLFTVDIDAKDAAPSPIGALFSGGLMNVGFLAILRFYQIFASTSILSWMNTVFYIVGIISILFAAVYILRVGNYKRLLAYSSLEHAGIALIAVASGGVGYFIAVFHLIFHSLTKASLFFQIGQVYKVFRGKNSETVGGYIKLNPLGGCAVLLGVFAITAMPPSGLFLSEFLLFKNLILNKKIFITVLLFLLLTIIISGLGKSFFKLLFTPLPKGTGFYNKVSPLESTSQWILMAAVIYCGINPPAFLTDFISQAVQVFPKYLPI